MARDDESFLVRWARRKQQREAPAGRRRPPSAGAEPDAKPAAEAAPAADGVAPAGADPAAEARRRALVDSLPDPDALGADDDVAQFLQDGVPDDLRRRALRRLWRVNPLFAHLDGLNDYDLDYTDAATVVANLKTAYKVGRGMVGDDPEAEPASAQAAQPAAPTAPQASPRAASTAEAHETEARSDAEPSAAASDASAAPASESPADASGAPAPASRTPRPRGAAARRRWGGDAA